MTDKNNSSATIKCPCDPAGVDGVTRETCCATQPPAERAPSSAQDGQGGLDVLRDMLAIQEACGLHTDEYAPGSVIEYIKELEAQDGQGGLTEADRENLELVIARLEQIKHIAEGKDERGLAIEALVCARAILARQTAPTAAPQGESCDVCKGTGYFYENDDEVGHVARECESCADAPQEQVERAAVPEGLIAIGRLLKMQDNRCTDQPMFVVQQRRRITGMDTGYCDNIIWLCAEDEYSEASADEAAKLEAEYQETGRARSGWIRTGYMDQWEFVTACFTEQGCKDYLARDGHNLKEPRIYVEGSYRNEEFRSVRNWLMSLAAAPAAQEGGAVDGWVSVKDRKPENEIAVLVIAEGWERPCVAAYFKQKDGNPAHWQDEHGDDLWPPVPTHWMPLPKAPAQQTSAQVDAPEGGA